MGCLVQGKAHAVQMNNEMTFTHADCMRVAAGLEPYSSDQPAAPTYGKDARACAIVHDISTLDSELSQRTQAELGGGVFTWTCAQGRQHMTCSAQSNTAKRLTPVGHASCSSSESLKSLYLESCCQH